MSEARQLASPAGALPDHPGCHIYRCTRWLCQPTFHTQLIRRGQPRRYCSPACRVGEHRRLN